MIATYSNLFYRMATTLAGLETGANFFILELPLPFVDFQGYTTTRPQSLGGLARHGYRSCTLSWEQLNPVAAHAIDNIIKTNESTAGVGNAVIYVTVPLNDAFYDDVVFADLSGRAHLPRWNANGLAVGGSYESPSLVLNNVTVEAVPSTVDTGS